MAIRVRGKGRQADAQGRESPRRRLLQSALVSVGFRDVAPPVPPREITLWVVRKDTREARAVVRVLSHGRELRVLVGDALMWSRLYRDDEDSRDLGLLADGCCADFVRLGWVRDAVADAVRVQ